ncbi:MAG TPA: OmpH family outer membrane protein [Rhodocyclaceae bacterium]|nr:OmpH family outer membrane protein [Rhodocyclaceae bacterium]
MSQDEFRIGFVNADRVMRESAPAMRAQKKLEKEFEKRDQELQRTSKQLQALQDSLDKNSVMMSDAERKQKERDYNDANREFQRKQREYREDRNQRQNEELAAVLDRANKTIRQVAEAEKFDLIVQEAVYFSPRIDITDKVIKALADLPAK